MPQRPIPRNPQLTLSSNPTFSFLWLILPLAMSLACQRQVSEESVLRDANKLWREGDLAQAERLLEGTQSKSDRLKILLAEIQLSSRKTDRGLALLQSIPEPSEAQLRARYLMNIAYGRFQKSDDDPSAREAIEKALDLARPAGPSETLALALFRQAYVYNFPNESEAWLREAGDIGRRLKDPYLEAWSLLDLGHRHYQMGEWDQALPYLAKSEALARSAGARRLENRAIGNSGICYFSSGDYGRAEKLFNRALSIARASADNAMIVRWLNDLGLVNLYRGDLEPAEKLYQESASQALAMGDRREYVRAVLNHGMTVLERGDAARAASILAAISSEPMDPAQRRRYLTHLARIQGAQGRTNEAAALFRQVIQESEEQNDFGILWIARQQISELFRSRGMNQDARREYLAAIHTVQTHWSALSEDSYRFTLLDGLRGLYSRVVDFFLDQHQPEEAARLAESGRANLLAERVGRAAKSPAAELPRPPAGTVFLSYWLGKERSALWVTTQSDFRYIPLPGEKTITDLVKRYTAAVREGTDVLEQEHPAGAELFRLLVEPASPMIPKGARVVLSLDRALHNLSFATLPVYRLGAPAHFWLEDVRISIAPSLLLLRPAPVKNFDRDPILVVGDPVPSPGFAELPHLATEIRRISGKVSSERLRLLTRQDATAKRYLDAASENYALIHFSAHATANHDSPLESAIILSPDGGRSKLYARDLVQRSLSTPLVCISSCTSAGTRSYSGEGLVGFAWAFLQAGAENVVAGLWEADDAGTEQLMDEFYTAVFNGMPVDAALQSAQLKLVRSSGRFRLPYYWGLFQVYSLRGY